MTETTEDIARRGIVPVANCTLDGKTYEVRGIGALLIARFLALHPTMDVLFEPGSGKDDEKKTGVRGKIASGLDGIEELAKMATRKKDDGFVEDLRNATMEELAPFLEKVIELTVGKEGAVPFLLKVTPIVAKFAGAERATQVAEKAVLLGGFVDQFIGDQIAAIKVETIIPLPAVNENVLAASSESSSEPSPSSNPEAGLPETMAA